MDTLRLSAPDRPRRPPLLAPCPDVCATEPGEGSHLHLGLLGDSTIAGVGVQHQRQGYSGRLAAHLAARTGRPVEWCTRVLNGARARDLRYLELQDAPTGSRACSPRCLTATWSLRFRKKMGIRARFRQDRSLFRSIARR